MVLDINLDVHIIKILVIYPSEGVSVYNDDSVE
jgi:hypothetical protein